MSVHCAGCDRPILDRFLLNVLDRAWHAKCVQCSDCKSSLTEKCFSRDGKLFCREDFFRRFGTKCGGCSQGISPNDLVRRARNKVFHLKCFTCMVCRKQLSTGEELYVLDENKFICKEDYLNSRYPGDELDEVEPREKKPIVRRVLGIDPGAGSDGEDLDADLEAALDSQDNVSEKDGSIDGDSSRDSTRLETNNNVSDPPKVKDTNIKTEIMDTDSEKKEKDLKDSLSGSENSNGKDDENSKVAGQKRRGPRTTIKAKQLETLKAAFAATPKPTRHIREQLAQETGLNMRVIQVWFQNRRSKERRMKQLSALGARRHFFRNPRRMRALRAGMSPHELDDSPEMMGQPGFNYFPENGEFYPGYQGYNEFFPGQGEPGSMNFLPPSSGASPIDGPIGGMQDGQYMSHSHDMLPPTSSPEPMAPMQHPDGGPYGASGPPRGMQGFGPLSHGPHEMVGETW